MFFKSKIISLISLSLFFSFLTVFAFTFSGFDQPLKSYKKEDKQGREQTYNWYVSLGLGKSWDLSSGHLGEDWVLLDQTDVDKNDISKAEIGQSVYSIADGVVFKVADWPECGAGSHGWGGVVLIKHQIPDDIDKKFNLTNTILPNPKETEEAKKAEQKRIKELEEKGTKVVYSMYGHLKNIQVKEGDTIKKGDKVGEIGEVCYKNSTKKYAPHLHFEIKDQNAIDGEIIINEIPGVGYGYSFIDGYAPDRYIPSNFIENNKNLIVEEKPITQPQPSPPVGLTGGNDSLSFWDKIVFYWNGFVANVKEIFGGSTGEVQVAKPLTQTEVQQQSNNGSASSPSAPRNDSEESPRNDNNKPEENSSPPLEPEVWNQRFISYKLDEKDKDNGIYQLTLRFQNTGNTTWTKDDVSLNVVGGHQGIAAKFYHQSWTTKLRPTTLTTTINPGDIATFTFTLQFPKDPNTYYPQFQPVRYIKDINDFSWIGTDKAIFLAEVKQSSSSALTFAGASVAEVINNDNDNNDYDYDNNYDSAQNPSSSSPPPNNTPPPTEEPEPIPEPTPPSSSPQDDSSIILPVPVPVLPNNGSTITDLNNAILTWEIEESFSQLTYILKIDDKESFNEPILLQKELNESQYALISEDIKKLGPGKFFWRVKAKSGDKESEWSKNTFSFQTLPVFNETQLKFYSTIQSAVDAANPGDIIIVNDGTYQENININKANLTIKSKNGADETIVETAPDLNENVFKITAANVTIDGFTIKGSLKRSGIQINTSNCKIYNNQIKNNNYGIRFDNISSGHEIKGNTITNNDVGIYLAYNILASSIKINFNNIFENSEYGIINDNSSFLDATNNWWGGDNGPHHSKNLSSTADNINDKINFIPWLNAPYQYEKSKKFNAFIDSNKNGEYDTEEPTFYTIQSAVDAVSSGDIIIVNDGMYKEKLSMGEKSNFTLKSKNGPTHCIIDGGKKGDVILISNGNEITIEGFTIQNSGARVNSYIAGINLMSSTYNNILNNNIINNDWGVVLTSSHNNVIKNNTVSFSFWTGIRLSSSNSNIIENNKISFTSAWNNISLEYSDNNIIRGNDIFANDHWTDVSFFKSNNNRIYFNNFASSNDIYSSISTNAWHSSEKITYTYNTQTYTNYLGNYWSDYTRNDANKDADRDGIGDTPYVIEKQYENTQDYDYYPLIEPIEKYSISSSISSQ